MTPDTTEPIDGATLTLTATESVTIRRSSPDVLEVGVTYLPGGGPPPEHLHPEQDETFELTAGVAQVRVNGVHRTLSPGDALEIPRGAVHQLWNEGDAPVRAIWQTRPRGRTHQWFEAIDALHRSGRVRSNGMPGPLALGVLLTEYRDVFRLASRPAPVVRAALAALGVLGRFRGYRARPR